MAIPRTRPYRGPALFSYGLRPLFLLGTLQALIAMLIWIAMLSGVATLPSAFAPRDWHIHSMLYGYIGAVIGGYLLTSMPNWTGRLPLTGLPLVGLVMLWFAGRIATAFSGLMGWEIAAAIDLAFLTVLLLAIAREIITGRNWRNLKIIALLTLLIVGNAVFHYEAAVLGRAEYGMRITMAVVAMLVIVIGGRLVPSFTRNHLTRADNPVTPRSFGLIDRIAIIAAILALVAWTLFPFATASAALLGLAGIAHCVRVAGWRGYLIRGDGFSLAMNFAYALVPLGFLVTGYTIYAQTSASVGLHLLAGAFALMTVAVMARLSLAHSRRAVGASPFMQAILLALALSIVARVAADFDPGRMMAWLMLAGGLWVAGFAGFAVAFAPIWCRPAQVRKPPRLRRESVAASSVSEVQPVDEKQLYAFLAAFYARARVDKLLGPVFTNAIPDSRWEDHIARIHAFWMRVLNGRQGYHGNPFQAHVKLGLEPEHFARWLALFAETSEDYFDAPTRGRLMARANRIAESLQAGLVPLSPPHHDS